MNEFEDDTELDESYLECFTLEEIAAHFEKLNKEADGQLKSMEIAKEEGKEAKEKALKAFRYMDF